VACTSPSRLAAGGPTAATLHQVGNSSGAACERLPRERLFSNSTGKGGSRGHPQQQCMRTHPRMPVHLLMLAARAPAGVPSPCWVHSAAQVDGACPAAGSGWRYAGGETRLVGIERTVRFSYLLQQLSKATSVVWDEVRCNLPVCTAYAAGPACTWQTRLAVTRSLRAVPFFAPCSPAASCLPCLAPTRAMAPCWWTCWTTTTCRQAGRGEGGQLGGRLGGHGPWAWYVQQSVTPAPVEAGCLMLDSASSWRRSDMSVCTHDLCLAAEHV